MAEVQVRYLQDTDGDRYFPMTHADCVVGLEERESNTSELNNKTIVCFGDSITELGTYPEQIGMNTGATIVKGGFAGCRMAQHKSDYAMNNQSMQKLVEFIANDDFTPLIESTESYYEETGKDFRKQARDLAAVNWSQVDYITIFFGTNDFRANMPIGTNSDFTENTFKGAINKVIKMLSESNPKIRVVFITPFYRIRYMGSENRDSDTLPNDSGIFLKEYVDAIKEITELNHFPCIDLMRLSGINKYNQETYLVDGLHPNDFGYTHISNILRKQLEIL